MSNSVDTMKNFVNVLKLYANDTTTDGVAILDHAVRTTTRFAGLHDAVNNFIGDMANVTATAGATQSLLQNCGIVIGAQKDFTADTGAVSGYNAGMGVLKNAQTIVPEDDVNLSELPLPAEGSTTMHSYTGADGQTFYFTISYPETYTTVVDNSTSPLTEDGYPDSSLAATTYLQAGQTYYSQPNSKGTYYSATSEQVVAGIQTLMRAMENYWAEQGLKLAYDSFGLDFNNKNLSVEFGINQWSQAETGPVASDPNWANGLPASNIAVEINAVMFATIDPDDPNGNTRVEGGAARSYLDRTIAHELIHAVMQASGTLKDIPEFITEGLAELVHGLDDFDGENTQAIAELATDSERLTQALALQPGFGTADAYSAGHMFLRYLCQQSQPVNVKIGTSDSQNFTYTGGLDIISGAETGSQITTAKGVLTQTASAAGDDMFVFTTAGNMIIRDARDKIINFASPSGHVYGRAYMSSTAGTIDGRTMSGYGFICGANFADNEIFAGEKGSEIWGGDYGTDTLYGGAGADNFITGTYCGNDTIYNANAEDTINLSATSLEQIIGTNVNENGVALAFSDGSFLTVAGNVGAKFVLANGSAYRANQAAGTFVNA